MVVVKELTSLIQVMIDIIVIAKAFSGGVCKEFPSLNRWGCKELAVLNRWSL